MLYGLNLRDTILAEGKVQYESNSFEISIPDLTNSYFNRFLIKGEYIRINKEKDMLFRHNEQYWRLGMDRLIKK